MSLYRLTVLMLCGLTLAFAQVAVPPLTGRVVDQTGTLTADQRQTLDSRLQSFESGKGSQVVVLMIPTTGSDTIEQFGIRVAEQWQIGRKDVDDGVILIVAKDDRTVRIEVGYGLEGVLNDATARRIIDEIIVPRFKDGDFYGGIDAGLERIMAVIDGEPLPTPSQSRSGGNLSASDQWQPLIPILFVIVAFGGGLLKSLLGRIPGAMVAGLTVGGITWWLLGALAMALVSGVVAFLFTVSSSGRLRPGGGFVRRGRGHRCGGGFSRGGGGFTGGGGSFGGGGASGRW